MANGINPLKFATNSRYSAIYVPKSFETTTDGVPAQLGADVCHRCNHASGNRQDAVKMRTPKMSRCDRARLENFAVSSDTAGTHAATAQVVRGESLATAKARRALPTQGRPDHPHD
ncbi:MAG TPA: hypothetical protein VMH92_05500 [Acidocella sp.]|nr:hypothetical protein [Acidocella sp.]